MRRTSRFRPLRLRPCRSKAPWNTPSLSTLTSTLHLPLYADFYTAPLSTLTSTIDNSFQRNSFSHTRPSWLAWLHWQLISAESVQHTTESGWWICLCCPRHFSFKSHHTCFSNVFSNWKVFLHWLHASVILYLSQHSTYLIASFLPQTLHANYSMCFTRSLTAWNILSQRWQSRRMQQGAALCLKMQCWKLIFVFNSCDF